MKLLLDTHIWIWMIISPEKLSRAVRRQLDDPKNQLFLSPVSVWEAYHVVQRKRIRVLRDSVSEWIGKALTQASLQEAPFNFTVAAQAGQITLPQSDIGDVFIAATACAYNLTLVTADAQLPDCSWLKTLSNN